MPSSTQPELGVVAMPSGLQTDVQPEPGHLRDAEQLADCCVNARDPLKVQRIQAPQTLGDGLALTFGDRFNRSWESVVLPSSLQTLPLATCSNGP